jgi:hypothetical protein
MNERQIKALFHQLADGEPDRPPPDVSLAHRRGQTRLKWRRARLTGTSMLAVAAVAGLAVGVSPLLSHQHQPAASSRAHMFNPLDPYLSFGWLPPREKLVAGEVAPQGASLLAGHTSWDPNKWVMQAAGAGQCHVRTQKLTCSWGFLTGPGGEILSQAPDVRGHPAYWDRLDLVWQWAPNSWALLEMPGNSPDQQDRQDAVRIANNVHYGAPTPPLLFALQLSGLPAKWRIGSVYYQVKAGQLRVTRFSLNTRPEPGSLNGVPEIQTNLPWFINVLAAYTPGQHRFCYLHHIKVINGYRIHTGPDQNTLCSNDAGGVAFEMNVQGSHLQLGLLQLFRSHLQLLGRNPGNWTTKPIR